MLSEGKPLRKGERIAFAGKRWKVVAVNECAATVVPLGKETIEVQGRKFKRTESPVRISPYSEVERI